MAPKKRSWSSAGKRVAFLDLPLIGLENDLFALFV